MIRSTAPVFVALALCIFALPAVAAEIRGDYVEFRTCDVYTGPCFANSEVGLTGQEAVLAWSIDEGRHNGVDLTGLKVLLAVRASDTLGFGGGLVVNPDPIKSVVLVDQRATDVQRSALVDFVRTRASRVAGDIVRVESAPIQMALDHLDAVAKVNAGNLVTIKTRALNQGDCVCTNEVVFYPPLTQVDNFAPAFTIEGSFSGRGLGSNWSTPKTRSAFLATFAY